MSVELIVDFEALAVARRAVVSILAVAEDTVSLGVVVKVFRRLRGVRLSESQARRMVDELVDAGWLRWVDHGWGLVSVGVVPAWHEPLVRHLIAQEEYEDLAKAWLREQPGYYHSEASLWRRLRLALVQGDAATFNELFDDADAPLGQWLLGPLQSELIERQRPDVQGLLLCNLLSIAAWRAQPVPGLHDLVLRSHPGRGQHFPDLALAEVLLHQGQLDRAQELLAPHGQDDAFRGLNGWLHLARGDVKGATQHYAKAMAWARKIYYDKNPFVGHADGPWLPLAFLLRGQKSRRDQGLRILRAWGGRTPDGSPYAGLGSLESLVDPVATVRSSGATHPTAVLMEGMVGLWTGKPLSDARLQTARQLALDCGWAWLAAELQAVRTGDDSLLEGVVALHTHHSATSAWEAGLDRLEAVLDGEGSSSGKRVAWTLTLEPFDLQAREQSKGKRGWTKGRKIDKARLANSEAPLASLSEADKRLLASLHRHEARISWRSRTWYEWEVDSAWRALCGHPRVFDAQGRALVIRRASPRLVLSENSRSLVIALDPPMSDEQVVRQVDDTTWEVFHLAEAQADLSRVLGKSGLRVPLRQGRERVAGLLGRLAQHFDIHDQTQLTVQAGPTREVQGSPVPVLQLRPEGQGFSVRLLVRPLGVEGPELTPGQGAAAIISRQPQGAVVIRRDLHQEQALADAVLEAAPVLQGSLWEDGHWHLPLPQDALELLEQVHDLGDQVGVEWPEGAELRLRAKVDAKRLSVSVTTADEWLSASGKLQVDEGLVLGLTELLAALDSSPGRFVALDDGSILALSAQLRRHLDRLSRAGTPRGDKIRVHRLASPLLQPLVEEAGTRRTDKGYKAQLQAALQPVSSVDLPRALQAELRPYQVDGFRWLCRLAALGAGACLADDMGLGKTVQALAMLLHRASDGPALVVAPTSVCAGWQQEAWRFAPSLQVHSLHQGDRAVTLSQLGPGQVLIASYGLLLSEAEALAQVQWSSVVLDEAQAIKNPNTRRHKAAMALQARFRMALSGTPVENHLGELWALFRFLNPGLLGSWERYRARFVTPVEEGDRDVARQLRDLVRPFVLRRTKSAVLHELPARTDITLRVELDAQEAAHYELVRRQALDALSRDDNPSPMTVLAQLTRLRLAACHPALVGGPLAHSAKLKTFGRLVTDLREGGHRALVFSQFVKHLAILQEWLVQQGIPHLYLDGSTPAVQRKQRVDAFQQGQGDLFLISLKAGGLGLNLTAADYVIHMDPWWNPAVEDQASDRAHRIGQTRPVTVYRLVAAGTVEERIVDLHARKRDLADQLLEGADAAARMGVGELVEVLRGGI